MTEHTIPDEQPQPFPNKKYKIIYADPAWDYNNKHTGGSMISAACQKYSTMPVKDICNLPVKEISDNDCILFLWATFPCLKEAIQVIESWGFQYKTIGFIWIKTNKNDGKPFFGIGHYTKSNSEPCLIGVKGSPAIIDDSVSSVIISPIKEHSKKPAEARTRIVRLMGDVSRIELFSRDKIEGWDCWGNQLPDSEQQLLKNGVIE